MNGRYILIDRNPFETRMGLVQEERVVEYYVERSNERGITGNIYKGRVVRVLPGMQAAFIEIGLERTAFLHVSDIRETLEDIDEEGSREEERYVPSTSRIQDLLREGQGVMVQVAKEPMGTKGARLTSYVSLPGRYLVLMPTYERIGVSRRIADDRERRRLREIVKSLRPQGYGFIIRTVCEGMKKEEIKADMDFLVRLWQGMEKKGTSAPTPSILYEELDLTLRTIRDYFSPDDRLIIGSRDEYDRAVKFVEEFMPVLRDRVELHEGEKPIFDAYGIEIELEAAMANKVWLRSGGHIVIDQLEALTAIDVNTGKYVGKKSSEETILKTNLEAANEIVFQLRLRNIGGIIVIDFIDMAKAANREKVYNTLRTALREDKARTNILKISELGIVEMTRKRVRESLAQSLCEPCPYCDGNGIVKAKDTVVMEIYRELLSVLPQRRRKAVLYVNPAIAERLVGEDGIIRDLRERFKKKVVIKPVEVFHQEEFEIV
jgi:ribonuclease G